MNRIQRIAIPLLTIGVVLLLAETGWSQCAMCRTALENSVEGQQMAEGFNQGILFLLAAPYTIIGGFSYALVRAFKKRVRQ